MSVSGGPAALQHFAAQTSDAFSSYSSPWSGTLVDVSSLGDDGFACNPLPADSLFNSIALIQRGPAGSPCSFITKANNAICIFP